MLSVLINRVTKFKCSIVISFVGICLSSTVNAKSTIESSGDILQYVLPITALSATFIVEDDYSGSIEFTKAFITSTLTTEVLKYSVNEQRPNGKCCESFPSGHTSAAFMGASFIHFRYGWEYGLPAYIAASFVGYSRVKSDQHYTRDVVAGAAIGVLSSYFFTTKYQGVNITPYAFDHQVGIQFSGSF